MSRQLTGSIQDGRSWRQVTDAVWLCRDVEEGRGSGAWLLEAGPDVTRHRLSSQAQHEAAIGAVDAIEAWLCGDVW